MTIRTIAALTSVALFTCTDIPTAWGQCQANESAKLLASDGAYGDAFGRVAISGATALVGAWGGDLNGPYSGSAYVFRFDGTRWIEVARLISSDNSEGDYFGVSTSIRGNTAIVGAMGDDDLADASGAAYVYRFDGSTWLEEAKLTASDGAAEDLFGNAVRLYGDRAIIGAYGDSDKGYKTGSAYVFRFDGTTWVEEAKLTASDGAQADRFGSFVDLHDGIACIGAWGDDDACPYDARCDSGSAYVFRFNGLTWVEEAKLTASIGAKSDHFGASLAISDSIIVVGASGDDEAGPSAGAVYVFRYNGLNWDEEVKLTASDGETSYTLGSSIDITGDTIVAGAPADDDNGMFSGSAYVFRFDGLTWVEEVKLTASDGAELHELGRSVAVSGDTALVGAQLDGGSVYVFRGLSDCNNNTLLDLCELSEGTAQDCNNNDVPDDCDIAGGVSIDDNGNGIPDECEVTANLDVKPGSCPNSVNTRSKGVVSMAIVGSDLFDVTQITIDSLTLSRADGVGGAVRPLMGPPGPGIKTDDVATPFTGELCDCHELAGDGIDDLLLKFSTPELAEALDLASLPPGTSVTLTVSGSLLDGTLFEASDCIVTVGKRPRVRPPGKRVR